MVRSSHGRKLFEFKNSFNVDRSEPQVAEGPDQSEAPVSGPFRLRLRGEAEPESTLPEAEPTPGPVGGRANQGPRLPRDAFEAELTPLVRFGAGDDTVEMAEMALAPVSVALGRGDDWLVLDDLIEFVAGGRGTDTLSLDRALTEFDVAVHGASVLLTDRITGQSMTVRSVESFSFDGRETDLAALTARFASASAPAIGLADEGRTLVVNDPDPSVSVIWDRVVQQAVMETVQDMGPTVASRAYAMVHTAIYDAWATHDSRALRVSLDAEGDNAALAAGASGDDAGKIKSMSYAAFTVLSELFPDMTAMFEAVMEGRFGLNPQGDGSLEAEIGLDAAADLLALRHDDGSTATGPAPAPVNVAPDAVIDIARWTPESTPIDPEGEGPLQSFLTPHWQDVEGFALPEAPGGGADYAELMPPSPQPFFAAGYEGSRLDMAAGTITLSAEATIGGTLHGAGETVAVSKALIGTVINTGFIAQAEHVVAVSAALTTEQKLIAEFWEHGGGSPFPPGAFMTIAEFVSARDGNSIDDDAKLFLAMGNAMLDAGVAAWHVKAEFDYVRPVRAIRDLGELGLIGELGVDELTGEVGHVIRAFAGLDPETGASLGTRTILAENFVTYQSPNGPPSPPFPEYISGHSAFSAAGAEVLLRFTGSDAFGGAAIFDEGWSLFDPALPTEGAMLAWDTFSAAADEAGMSRLYGGIHFTEGDVNGRALGREIGAAAFDVAMSFYTGTASDEDRPFFTDDLLV